MFKNSVTKIMADFAQKINDLEKLKEQKYQDRAKRSEKISELESANTEDANEMAYADRVIFGLRNVLS